MRFILIAVAIAALCPAYALTQSHPADAAPASAESQTGEEAKPPAPRTKVDESIVVTATRSERSVSQLPVSATVVDEEELETAPALWMDDVLRTVPGVHAPMSGSSATIPSRQRFSMRGLGGNRALVLLDGVPIHDPYIGTVQWQKVPVGTVSQVEVVRGGNASLFGNSALGGTVNLITRPVTATEVRAEAAWGSSGTDRQVLSLDHPFSSSVAARFNHFRYDSRGYFQTPDPGPVDIPAWNDTAVTNGRVDFTPTDATRLTVRSSYSELNVSQGTPLSYSDSEILDASATVHHGLGNNALLSATLFHQDQTERLVGTNVVGARESEFVSNDATAPVKSSGASLEWSLNRGGPLALLSFGVDVSRTTASEHRQTFGRTGAVTQEAETGGEQSFGGLFAQTSWRPAQTLEVLVSGRLDYYRNAAGFEDIAGGTSTDFAESSSTQFDPRLSVRYGLGNHAAVRGSVYRAFKAPTLRELYRSTQSNNTITLGNPLLGPETLVGGEVGFEWTPARSRFEVNLYRNEIEGLRARAPVPGQPSNVIQQMNLGTARSQGVEALAEVQLTRTLALNTGYTYADSQITEDPDPAIEGKLVPEVVPHIGTFSLRYHGGDGTTVDLRGRILSTSYAEATNSVPSPAHRVFDLSFARPIFGGVSAFAVLENALDEKYHYAVSRTTIRAAQPRTLTAGLRLTFSPGGAGTR